MNGSAGAPADPATDVLGWENGYWANETLAIDQSDGLSDAELEAYVSRAMARVEAIRGLEFERELNVTVQSRAALVNATATDTFRRMVLTPYYNQLFEAMFIVDERTDAYDAYVGEDTATLGGYYAVGQNRIVIVAEDRNAPVIDEYVLVHELTHAAQDQHFDLEAGYRNSTTLDGLNGRLGLLEGDANYVAYRYQERCDGVWQCVATPGSDGPTADFNVGIYLGGYNPYSDGPSLVATLRERSGDWSAVNAAYTDPPVSSEQVIHPERYPDDRPGPLTEPAGPEGDWELFGVERVGEAWLYAMLFYQDAEYGIPVIDRSTFFDVTGGMDDTYNYTSVPSEGWSNDELRMYAARSGDARGYTWTLAWDTERDAREFRDAYLEVLAGHGAQQRGPNTWVIPEDNPYADAFRVVLDGDTVTIVNAPTVADLETLAPGLVADRNGTASG